MEEKMLVTQALDERDLLVKKINSKINKLKFVDTKKRNEEKTVGERLEVEEFRKQALSSYQQKLQKKESWTHYTFCFSVFSLFLPWDSSSQFYLWKPFYLTY